MKGGGGSRSLRSLCLLENLLSQTKSSEHIKKLPTFRPLATTATADDKTNNFNKNDQVPRESKRDSLLLEKFRHRKLQGSSKPTAQPAALTPPPDVETARKGGDFGTNEISSFEDLGLKEEIVWAAAEMDFWIPSEIQCVGIPAILEGKSVVLSSDSGSGRTLAYLMPIIQLLRRDEASRMKPNHPTAVILCSTEELSDEVFRMAKFFIDFARLKSARESGSQSNEVDISDAPIGLLIGTPGEILQQMEEGSIFSDHMKYLVLDEADAMIDHEFGPEISKIASRSKNIKSDTNNQGFQTIFVTSTMSKMLGEEFSPIMKRLEHDNAGKVTAMLLEMDKSEVIDVLESPDKLKKKVVETMDSLAS